MIDSVLLCKITGWILMLAPICGFAYFYGSLAALALVISLMVIVCWAAFSLYLMLGGKTGMGKHYE
jgi:hypothetical protein